MSLPVPLAVRLATARTELDVTAELRSLNFREVAQGGWASAAFSIDRPLGVQPDEIAHYARVYIDDIRTGRTVWEGRLDDPARGVSDQGSVWNLVALGPSAHTLDRTVPLIYVERDLARLLRVVDVHTPGASSGVGDDPGGSGAQALVLQFPSGTGVDATSRCTMRYSMIAGAGQKLARVSYTQDAGFNSVNFQNEAVARNAGGSNVASSINWNTAATSPALLIVTNWTAGRDVLELAIDCDTSGTPADDLHWGSFRDLAIVATRYTKAGAELVLAADYPASTVLASEVVADLLGRLLTAYDGVNAVVTTTSFAIDRLAYPDGVNPSKVLDDLLALETGMRWGAYESNAAGKHRFEFIPWPTTVRYEADVADGFESPSSSTELFNQVTVRYRDVDDSLKTVTRTQTVEVLDAAGLIRTDFIDLGAEIGSLANAERAGDQFLAEHGTPPNAGRLTVARQIIDYATGRLVSPWEVKAGELIRVRGVVPNIDALNATARDGVTVFRIATKEVDGDTGAATLELDSYSRSAARSVAEVRAAAQRRRR